MLPAPFSLTHLGCIDSTNDEARRAAASGAGHGTIIWATEQTAGRGRRGRVWGSPPGNLYCSFLLDPGGDPALAPQLTFVAAIALAATLSNLLPASAVALKWPNDVLCDGRKIAGMLLEWAAPLAILGVGVNVATVPAIPLAFPATCLHQLGCVVAPRAVITAYCHHLAESVDRWRCDGFAPIRLAWLSRAVGLGGPITVRLADETVVNGLFQGLDGDGALILADLEGKTRRVIAGDVYF